MRYNSHKFICACALVLATLVLIFHGKFSAEQGALSIIPVLPKPHENKPAPPGAISQTRGLLRYDAVKDPRWGGKAAVAYYQQREQMIRFNHGDGQIDKPVAMIRFWGRTTSQLLTALSAIERQEIVAALPYVENLLGHSTKSVQSAAAETLCWFGDRRGFDFLMEKRGQTDGWDEWGPVFERAFSEYKPQGYNEQIRKLMLERKGPKMSQLIDSKTLATLLLQLGDPSGLDLVLDSYAKYPPLMSEAILPFKNIDDPRAIQSAREFAKTSQDSKVRQAAGVVLAAHGDQAAQQQIVEAARRLIDLPQPQNSNGTYKPGMQVEVAGFGIPTPGWDAEAYFALNQGMEVVPAEQAVPLLKDIAMRAQNVRYSDTAIKLLAKIGNEEARNALWKVVPSLQKKQRTFEDAIFTTAGKALMLYNDETSASLAKTMFGADKPGMNAAQLVAETRGWDGLFKRDLFY